MPVKGLKQEIRDAAKPNVCNLVMVRLGREARVKGLPCIIEPLKRKP